MSGERFQPVPHLNLLFDPLVQELQLDLNDLFWFEIGAGKNAFDVFECKSKPLQQFDLLQTRDIEFRVYPVSGFGFTGRFEQADLVILVKRSDRESGLSG